MSLIPNVRIVSVSEVTEYLRILTESDPFLSDVWIEGDVTKSFVSKAGHLYFSVSDGVSTINAIAFRANASRMQHVVLVGHRLVVGGRISVYTKDGTCQLNADYADATGMGVQALELARLRARLEAEGLFEPARKRPLPAFPRAIGVATSPAGAVIQDIKTVLRRRFPFTHLLVAPCQVQGDRSPESVASAIDLLVADGRAQVIIVARGGGSAEDLAGFNDERIARAAFACPVPVVSAIGHEIDYCILDDVADLRAPTPTAAAELCTPDVADFALEIIDAKDRLTRTTMMIVRGNRSEHEQAFQRVDRSSPYARIVAERRFVAETHQRTARGLRNRLAVERVTHQHWRIRLRSAGLRLVDQQRISIVADRNRFDIWRSAAFQSKLDEIPTRRELFLRGARRQLERRASDLRVLEAKLFGLDPVAVLGRGFSRLTDERGVTISSIQHVSPGAHLDAHLNDGTIHADVIEATPRTS